MTMRRLLVGLLVGSALLLGGCTNDCRKACEKIQTLCDGANGFKLDLESCVSNCENNLDGCKNQGEQESCVLAATTCRALEACPGCLQ